MSDRLWYRQPPSRWVEYLPIGNGVLGAMVSSGVPMERLALNHEWLWRANGRFRDVEPSHQHLDEIRELFFEGQVLEAGQLANARLGGPGGILKAQGVLALVQEVLGRLETDKEAEFDDPMLRELAEAAPEIRRMMEEGELPWVGQWVIQHLGRYRSRLRERGIFNRVDPYQPAGDLMINLGHGQCSGYTRQLDLRTGVVDVRYQVGDVAYHRQCYAHCNHPFIAYRVRVSEPEVLDMTLALDRAEDAECELSQEAAGDQLYLAGRFVEGSQFSILARVQVPSKGELCVRERSLMVTEATEAVVYLTVAVAHDGEDVAELASRQLAEAQGLWETLQESHTTAFQGFYDRVSLEMGQAKPEMPTDQRLAVFKEGETDPDLLALFFNYGRYLLISSSRPGGLPANLQGIWNEDINPPWECDLHHDVNLQMNYWAAETCDLADCIEPLFDHLERFVPHGRQVAQALFGCDGIFMPLQTDPWGRATPESRGWDVWTGAAAWLAQHLWWRYAYGRDVDFLRQRAYPYMREVAAFYQSYLVEDPRDPEGRLVTVPSQSPENFFVGGTTPVSLCIAATMDLELIDDLLTHAIAASEILDVDAELREAWREILERIPALRIGRHGQLQEWLEDYEEGEVDHRHLSHLVAAYPGEGITLEETPVLAQAVRVALGRRMAAGAAQGGWSGAWAACLWARLRDPEVAYKALRSVVANGCVDSLLNARRVFQIDANFGGVAAVAEMLLQSHGGVIRVLPALPQAWPEGHFQGFRARGGFSLDVRWVEGAVRFIRLHSKLGEPCHLQFAGAEAARVTRAGEVVPVEQTGHNLRLGTMAGATYEIQVLVADDLTPESLGD